MPHKILGSRKRHGVQIDPRMFGKAGLKMEGKVRGTNLQRLISKYIDGKYRYEKCKCG